MSSDSVLPTAGASRLEQELERIDATPQEKEEACGVLRALRDGAESIVTRAGATLAAKPIGLALGLPA